MSTSTSLIGTSPYPGLRPFRSDETGIFFGREEQVDELLARLDRCRFLAIVGPSGCGKSSLVRAGMIPALETGFLAQAGVHWRVATMRPGDRPLRRLAEALLAESALAPEHGIESETVAFLHATLRRGPLGMVDVWRETPLPERTNLLLLVDQFEEIFRYRQQGDSDEADAFVALLLATAAQRQAPVYVVMTMRSDFFGDCGVFRGLPEAINAGQFLTPRLTRDQCEAAIANPAMVFGGKVEATLVNRLLNDMGEEADQLPLMQHVLMRLWTHASVAMPAYENAAEPAGAATGTAAHAAGVTLRRFWLFKGKERYHEASLFNKAFACFRGGKLYKWLRGYPLLGGDGSATSADGAELRGLRGLGEGCAPPAAHGRGSGASPPPECQVPQEGA